MSSAVALLGFALMTAQPGCFLRLRHVGAVDKPLEQLWLASRADLLPRPKTDLERQFLIVVTNESPGFCSFLRKFQEGLAAGDKARKYGTFRGTLSLSTGHRMIRYARAPQMVGFLKELLERYPDLPDATQEALKDLEARLAVP